MEGLLYKEEIGINFNGLDFTKCHVLESPSNLRVLSMEKILETGKGPNKKINSPKGYVKVGPSIFFDARMREIVYNPFEVLSNPKYFEAEDIKLAEKISKKEIKQEVRSLVKRLEEEDKLNQTSRLKDSQNLD